MALYFDKVSYSRFQKALKKASGDIDDLRVPLRQIGERFLKSRNFIFDKKRVSEGQYKDLSPRYKRYKRKHSPLKKEYPILFWSGVLKKSITQKGGHNVFIVEKKSLEIGTTLPYAIAHQRGSGNLPKREFLFWGPESKKFANAKMVHKLTKSMAVTLFNHVERELGGNLGAERARENAEKQADKLFGRSL